MAQAQEEANRTLAIAREKSEQLVSRDAIVQAAQARAEQIVAQAKVDIESTRQDADEYVVDTLTRLEIELERAITQVRNGIQVLQHEKHPEEQTPQT
jgi:hypothetical protein